MTVTADSVPFSDLLRQPTETADRVARTRAVRLRRRDAADLMLMSAERVEAEGEVLDIIAHILSSIARRAPEFIGEVLSDVLPWTRFLPEADFEQMIGEFVTTAEAAGSIGNLLPIRQLLIEWQHTAEIYADPYLYQALTERPLGDFGPAPKPEAA